MREPVVACLRHPRDEAPDVARRQSQEGTRLHLRQLFLHRLPNDMHSPECLHTYG